MSSARRTCYASPRGMSCNLSPAFCPRLKVCRAGKKGVPAFWAARCIAAPEFVNVVERCAVPAITITRLLSNCYLCVGERCRTLRCATPHRCHRF
ncbi:hypothetical protein RCIA193 [Methanocella arvoryzae MRE50]|uniref:Uncharacterized protein n=1 Tax=Methanocella arvoryzae (strain DSM 22066 / NBRC 105507 / MRE50) TaxID=351160 RepID=Q0W1Q0_METAR|nr:hypothetical protein RCIA193 [Methanocella arvoryzae MRE50]